MLNRLRLSVLTTFVAFSLVLQACGGPPPATPTEQQEDPEETPVTAPPTTQAAESLPTEIPTDVIVIESTATPTEPPLPTDTPAPSPTLLAVNVTGEVCFPDGEIPSMTAYFEATDSESLVELPIAAGQSSYSVKLSEGIYIAYAWLPDFSRGGLYSRAVPCGLNVECEDHTVLAFSVSEEALVSGIDICDWYAGPFNVPYPPGKEPEQLTGDISGSLTYIQEEVPGLRVVAFNLSTNYFYWSSTMEGQTFYTIADLPPGDYNVVAYDEEGRAGGHANGSHELVSVAVRPGETTSGVDVTDWNAPEGTFPPDPTR
jgi:hypothetical protein